MVGGLEVLDPGGSWVGVEPVRGAFVINIGDLMARWTNDRWRSTLHRVVDPPDPAAANARRQSMPYFQNANWSAAVCCLPTCLPPGERPRYDAVLAGAPDGQVPQIRQFLTFAESSPETSKVRIGREKPRNDSSPTSRLTTNSSAAACTRWVTRICQGAASAHRRAAR